MSEELVDQIKRHITGEAWHEAGSIAKALGVSRERVSAALRRIPYARGGRLTLPCLSCDVWRIDP